MTNLSRVDHSMQPKDDTLPFIGIFVVGFVVFGSIAVVAQLLQLPWRSWFPGAESHKSLLGGVKASVYTFMSYLI